MLLHRAQAIVYMEMSIAIGWGKERLLRWASFLHGNIESLSEQEGTRKSTRLHSRDEQDMMYMVMELALLSF